MHNTHTHTKKKYLPYNKVCLKEKNLWAEIIVLLLKIHLRSPQTPLREELFVPLALQQELALLHEGLLSRTKSTWLEVGSDSYPWLQKSSFLDHEVVSLLQCRDSMWHPEMDHNIILGVTLAWPRSIDERKNKGSSYQCWFGSARKW